MSDINLQLASLNFAYKKQNILKNISLNLSNPQMVTLLGPNGAGKSTLLKSMAAVLYCQSGSVTLNAIDAENNRLSYLPQIGFMPEAPLVVSELTVIEQLQLIANIKQVINAEQAIERVVSLCQLQDVVNKRTGHLSLGYRQRLNLAQAILNKPKLLVMDEPLNGLDPHLIIEFRNIIGGLKKDTLIIMSTHYLAEAELVSDRVLIMQNGQMLDNIERKDSETFDLETVYMQHTSATQVVT